MKRFYIIGFISIVLLSCSKDEIDSKPISKEKEEIKVNNFSSEEEMENKINEILMLKEQKEKVVLENFESKSNSKKDTKRQNVLEYSITQTNSVINDLVIYHKEKLKGIYELRKEVNFTSIQSIADEINSLILVDSTKAKGLILMYQKFLVQKEIGIETVFDYRIGNVVNANGELLLNNEKVNLDKSISTNNTKRSLGDESTISGIAALDGRGYCVYYYVGREVHKNFLGVRYFRYFTELDSYMMTPYGIVSCPSTFVVNSNSKAGFVQTQSQFFSDYSFTYPYISGFGASVRYVGGDKNTPYYPAGGNISGKFSTTVGGVYREMNCNITYKN